MEKTRFENALEYAMTVHGGQYRKYGKTPFILHPAEVAGILAGMTDDEDLLIAGLLHDSIEDAGISAEDIRSRFGDRVTELVLSETESKMRTLPKGDTWLIRKEQTLAIVEKTKDLDVKKLWLADKLSNMRSFYREFLKYGNEIWQRLNQKDPKKQEWYYRSVAKCVTELNQTAAYEEYVLLIEKVFGGNEK